MMCRPDYNQVTKSQKSNNNKNNNKKEINYLKQMDHSSIQGTVTVREFITRWSVDQASAKSLNTELKSRYSSGHSTVIVRGFITRWCVNRITANYVTESGIHRWITISGHSTVILRRFLVRRWVNQTTGRSLNHEYIAGSQYLGTAQLYIEGL